MKNIILITSVINTPNTSLSYCSNRSVYSREERFEQTKETIHSIRNKIPDSFIFLVECTDFSCDEKDFFENNCDYILNLWDNKNIHSNIFGISKSLGEGTMTIAALEYIIHNKLQFDNLFKISGRYFLNDNFNYKVYDNDKCIFKKINGDPNNISTALYKVPSIYIEYTLQFLKNNVNLMYQCIGYEVLFGLLINNIDINDIIFCDILGIQGYISVTVNELYIG